MPLNALCIFERNGRKATKNFLRFRCVRRAPCGLSCVLFLVSWRAAFCQFFKHRGDAVLQSGLVGEGDTLIDGGNAFWKDDVRRGRELEAKGLHYLDIGTSGGVHGLEFYTELKNICIKM